MQDWSPTPDIHSAALYLEALLLVNHITKRGQVMTWFVNCSSCTVLCAQPICLPNGKQILGTRLLTVFTHTIRDHLVLHQSTSHNLAGFATIVFLHQFSLLNTFSTSLETSEARTAAVAPTGMKAPDLVMLCLTVQFSLS